MTCLFADLDFVIVNYCTPQLVKNCVHSILQQGLSAPENITVVDNASPDNSIEVLRSLPAGIRVFQSGKNAGFGSGVNFGVAESNSEYVLVLNPDTYFQDRSIERAISVMRSANDIGLVGLDLIYPNGRRQYSSRRFYTLLDIIGRRSVLGKFWPVKQWIEGHVVRDAWETGAPFDTEWVMGAGFIIRRAVFEKIGRMDENYFLYMEDVDVCARVWRAGYRVVCVPDARLVHDHQRASASGPFSRAGKAHLRSLLRFRRKFGLPMFLRPGISGIVKCESRN